MPPSSLELFIRREIESNGPMHMGEFMEHVLMHPELGYYQSRDPFGAKGDFTTAPEISQIFGEILAAWYVDVWQKMERPEPFAFLECGPGRGTLMRDILRVASKIDAGFVSACRPFLLEGSAALKDRQMDALADYDLPYRWIETLDELPDDMPLLMVANEFFDALPIRQVEKRNEKWQECCVGMLGGKLDIMHQPATANLLLYLKTRLPDAYESDVFEVSPVRISFMRDMLSHIKKVSGAFLIIDYGHIGRPAGVTLQAVYQHRYVHVFDHLGDADLSAHVDFRSLIDEIKMMGKDFGYGISEQGHFLNSLGADIRRNALIKCAPTVDVQLDIDAGYQRLTSIDAMGQLFKVLGGVSGFEISLPGF